MFLFQGTHSREHTLYTNLYTYRTCILRISIGISSIVCVTIVESSIPYYKLPLFIWLSGSRVESFKGDGGEGQGFVDVWVAGKHTKMRAVGEVKIEDGLVQGKWLPPCR